MGFQHTFYLKRYSALGEDERYDGDKVHWIAGCRDFAHIVEYYGTKSTDLDKVEFTPVQLLKFVCDLNDALFNDWTVLINGYHDYVENVMDNENSSAEMKAMDSYAILRNIEHEIREISSQFLEEMEEPSKLKILVKALGQIATDMNDDDILVWELSY